MRTLLRVGLEASHVMFYHSTSLHFFHAFRK
jgi:hypothetical protein